jgi:hypothetical protein
MVKRRATVAVRPASIIRNLRKKDEDKSRLALFWPEHIQACASWGLGMVVPRSYGTQ